MNGEQLHREGAGIQLPCVLVARETRRICSYYTEDDDGFLAVVSRGWSKHFPKITRKRERNPTGGGYRDGRHESGSAVSSRTEEDKLEG